MSPFTMNELEAKASQYVNAGKVHVHSYTIDKDTGQIVTASGHVDGTHRYQIAISPAGTRCSCQFGDAHGVTSQPHSHDIALRLAVWQMERINEQ